MVAQLRSPCGLHANAGPMHSQMAYSSDMRCNEHLHTYETVHLFIVKSSFLGRNVGIHPQVCRLIEL